MMMTFVFPVSFSFHNKQTDTGKRWRSVRPLIGVLVLLAACAPLTDNLVPNARYRPTCRDSSMSSGSGICQTDDRTVTYHFRPSMSAADRSNTSDALLYSFHTTDLNVTRRDVPVTEGSSETDVIYQKEAFMPSGADGVTWCNDAVGGHRCDQHYVRFRAGIAVSRGLACHETGHAVGLLHGSNGSPSLNDLASVLKCMGTPVLSTRYGLGSHNASQINGTY